MTTIPFNLRTCCHRGCSIGEVLCTTSTLGALSMMTRGLQLGAMVGWLVGVVIGGAGFLSADVSIDLTARIFGGLFWLILSCLVGAIVGLIEGLAVGIVAFLLVGGLALFSSEPKRVYEEVEHVAHAATLPGVIAGAIAGIVIGAVYNSSSGVWLTGIILGAPAGLALAVFLGAIYGGVRGLCKDRFARQTSDQ